MDLSSIFQSTVLPRNGADGETRALVEQMRPAVYETAAVCKHLSLLSHIGEMVGRHGFAPCSIRVRAGASLSKFATLGGRPQGPRREGGVEPPQPDL